eukprot:TRINITY_DN24252_c0_g1_i1.p1 TRINITY_DN24252_c0_g1~~TRINITY_DN24252_c0_g1_i1.p1  ORF type:complete len:105 (+),score=11.89 TRINITY_DN24252_c0_g1_i1:27-341(+)
MNQLHNKMMREPTEESINQQIIQLLENCDLGLIETIGSPSGYRGIPGVTVCVYEEERQFCWHYHLCEYNRKGEFDLRHCVCYWEKNSFWMEPNNTPTDSLDSLD